MKTIYGNAVPAIPFYCILRQFARAKGMPFFTHLEKRVVMKAYEQIAITQN